MGLAQFGFGDQRAVQQLLEVLREVAVLLQGFDVGEVLQELVLHGAHGVGAEGLEGAPAGGGVGHVLGDMITLKTGTVTGVLGV